jgi:ABC-type amino acid transport substrate-binding protein
MNSGKLSMKKISLAITIVVIIITSAFVWYRAEKRVVYTPQSDTIIVGTNAEFPPFSLKHDDAIIGFDIDVITQVLKRLNKHMVIKDMPFDALIPEIQLGNIHIIAAGITPTPERAQRALFTRPHLAAGNPLIIISHRNQPLTTLQDLAGKTVVVNEGYTSDTFMSEQHSVNLLRLSSAAVSDGMLALESGRADAFVTALHSIKPYFKVHDSSTFSITPIPSTDETSAFAISKYYPELRDYIQVTLDRMQEDGTLANLKSKWNLS